VPEPRSIILTALATLIIFCCHVRPAQLGFRRSNLTFPGRDVMSHWAHFGRACLGFVVLLVCVLAAAADSPGEGSAANLSPQQISAQKFPRAEWGAPEVDVAHDAAASSWTLKGKKQTVTLDDRNLAIGVRAGRTAWNMVPSGAGDMMVKVGDQEFPVR